MVVGGVVGYAYCDAWGNIVVEDDVAAAGGYAAREGDGDEGVEVEGLGYNGVEVVEGVGAGECDLCFCGVC